MKAQMFAEWPVTYSGSVFHSAPMRVNAHDQVTESIGSTFDHERKF